MKQPFLILMLCLFTNLLWSQRVGIGTDAPQRLLHIYDTSGIAYPFLIENTNPNNLIVEMNTLANNSSVGIGMFRNNVPRAFALVNSSNNFVLNMPGSGNRFILTPAGNIGIGENSPGFPLNFPSVLGDKISLYGTSGNTYGFGIQQSALQIHTDVSGADIVFGYGSSSAFNERMRVKGNGRVGIGTSTPSVPLDVVGDVKTSGNLYVQNDKAILRTNSSTTQKVVDFSEPYSTTLGANASSTQLVTFEAFTGVPKVFVANLTSPTGDAAKVIVTITSVLADRCTVTFFNPTSASITFGATYNFVAIGNQ